MVAHGIAEHGCPNRVEKSIYGLLVKSCSFFYALQWLKLKVVSFSLGLGGEGLNLILLY